MIILDQILDGVYRKSFPIRHDGNPVLRYPSPSDFGMRKEPFSFLSCGNRLYGYRYSDGSKPKAVLLFFHGATAGHRAYTAEIVAFCKQGYLVYAYDYTGCMSSEGKDCNGMGQPLFDQKAFFEFLEKDEPQKGLTRFAVGHSWGGFCALSCLKEEYNVSKVICLAGFDSIAEMSSWRFGDRKKTIRRILEGYLKRKYGPIALFDGLEAMKKTTKEVLCVSGDKDDVVDYSHFFKRYEKEASSNPHVHFLSVKDRGHQCYWTPDAQRYYLDIALNKHVRELQADPKFVIDFSRLMQDDEKVMQSLFDFLSA